MVTRFQVGFILYALVVIAISLYPSQGLAAPGSLDKVGHFIAYAVMGAWGLAAFRGRRSSILVIVFCILLGLGLEYLQHLVSGRDPSIADGIANILGLVTGVGVSVLWRKVSKAAA